MVSKEMHETAPVADGAPGAAGPPAVLTVPNVVGQDLSVAQTTLTQVGLVPRAWLVKSSVPAAGAQVPPGSSVWLEVANQTQVPNVIGQLPAPATTTMQQAGLHATVEVLPRSQIPGCPPGLPAGQVGGTVPQVGSFVPVGSTVTLLVVQQTAVVPDVEGLHLSQALPRITQAHLVPHPSPANAPGTWFVSQTIPPAGTEVPLNSGVTLHAQAIPP